VNVARTTGLYADDTQLPQPTGSDVQRVMAAIHLRLVARYKLTAVPGRPEELACTLTGRRVSLGYGCKSIRVRKQDGSKWLDRIDIQVRDGWHGEVYAFLDPWFGFVSPATLSVTSVGTGV
jgi:hypothetical protein